MRMLLPMLGGLLLALSATMPSAAVQPGPSPYPTEARAWPGEGAIRVFGWMKLDRARFWKDRERQQGAVVLAGDSLLGGWKTAERDLQPLPVANRAIGGDTSRGLLFRFDEDVLALKPSRVVLLIGGNDLSALQDTDQTARNIERMLDATAARSADTPVVLCTLLPRANPKAPVKPSELDALNAKIRAIAASRKNVTLLDLYPWFATPESGPDLRYYGSDQVHLSSHGYTRLAEAMRATLKPGV